MSILSKCTETVTGKVTEKATGAGGASVAAAYMLRATFNAANDAFADNELLNTTTSGCEDGRMIAIRNAAGDSVDIDTNELVITGTVLNTNRTGIIGTSPVPRTRALANIIKFASTHNTSQGYFGLSNKPLTVDGMTTTEMNVVNWTLGTDQYSKGSGGIIDSITASSEMEMCWVLGAFNVDEEPWSGSGSIKDHLYGSHHLKWNGTNWTNLYVSPFDGDSQTPFVHCMNNTATVDQISVPDACYRGAIVPTVSTLTPANSSTFTHDADQVLLFSISTLPTTDCYIDIRRTDDNNRWRINIDSSGNLDLIEVASGTTTTRGTSASAVTVGDHFVIVCDDETITIHRDRASNTKARLIHYTSAASNKTATGGQVTLDSAVIDYVASWPRTGYSDIPNTSNLPSATAKNPSTASDDIVVLVGDSMMDGNNLNVQPMAGFCQVLLGGNATVFDDAAGGSRIETVDNVMPTSNARMGTGNNYLIICAGTNNLMADGETASEVNARLDTLINQERAYTGGGGETWTRIYLMYIADRAQTSLAITPAEHTARRTVVNAYMDTLAATYDDVEVVDWTTDRTFTDHNGVVNTIKGFADCQSTDYGNGDDVHPNYIGSAMMAEHWYRVHTSL